jgi:hypothetical protein
MDVRGCQEAHLDRYLNTMYLLCMLSLVEGKSFISPTLKGSQNKPTFYRG